MKIEAINEETVDETVAADTLHPAAMAIAQPDSRTEKIAAVIGHLATVDKESLTKIWDAVMAKAAEIGHGPGVGNVSGSNAATLSMKPSNASPSPTPAAMAHIVSGAVKEDLNDIFAGTELSEEFKEKTATLFEAAVNARTSALIAEAEELLINEVEEFKAEYVGELTEKLDSYLGYVTDTWLEENEVQITNSIRADMTESFIDGMKNLFASHYIELPEERVDVLEALTAELAELETKLDEVLTENASLRKENTDAVLETAFDDVAEGLVMTQAEKFKVLSEGISYDGTVEDYVKKLLIIKEKHFPKNSVAQNTLNEEVDGSAGEVNEALVASGPMKRYAQAISNTVKR